MTYLYLLIAGLTVSIVHFYLVWRQKENRRYSISENAVIDHRGHVIYIISHIICDVFIVLYAYQFFAVQQKTPTPFYLFLIFAILDFVQALLPSKGKTEIVHFAAAYISWVSYILAGIVALIQLDIKEPFKLLATLLLIPVIGMFVYMHINRTKLYPYQLLMAPMFVAAMLLVTIGVG